MALGQAFGSKPLLGVLFVSVWHCAHSVTSARTVEPVKTREGNVQIDRSGTPCMRLLSRLALRCHVPFCGERIAHGC